LLDGFEMLHPLVTHFSMSQDDVAYAVQQQVGVVPVQLYLHVIDRKTELVERLSTAEANQALSQQRNVDLLPRVAQFDADRLLQESQHQQDLVKTRAQAETVSNELCSARAELATANALTEASALELSTVRSEVATALNRADTACQERNTARYEVTRLASSTFDLQQECDELRAKLIESMDPNGTRRNSNDTLRA
jgi:chromosome segregation ATPase